MPTRTREQPSDKMPTHKHYCVLILDEDAHSWTTIRQNVHTQMYLREASERKEEKILHIEEHVKNLQLEKKKDNKMYTVTTTTGELRKLQVFVAAKPRRQF